MPLAPAFLRPTVFNKEEEQIRFVCTAAHFFELVVSGFPFGKRLRTTRATTPPLDAYTMCRSIQGTTNACGAWHNKERQHQRYCSHQSSFFLLHLPPLIPPPRRKATTCATTAIIVCLTTPLPRPVTCGTFRSPIRATSAAQTTDFLWRWRQRLTLQLTLSMRSRGREYT